MFLIKNSKSLLKIYILENEKSNLLHNSVQIMIDSVKEITGAVLSRKYTEDITKIEKGIVLSLFNLKNTKLKFEKEYKKCDKDGFCVIKENECIYILAHNYLSLFYGVVDFLEKNTNCLWTRGAEEEQFAYLKTDTIEIKYYNYFESSPFTIRSWNMCGNGSDNKSHKDTNTSKYLIRNKVNGTSTFNDSVWREYGVRGSGITFKELQYFDDEIDEHPEWFMRNFDGKIKTALYNEDSFLNYYNLDLAKSFAIRLVKCATSINNEDIIFWRMPDSPHFNMIGSNGEKLQEKSFKTDDGKIVNPKDKNYKSTVYFNFLNRVIKEANKISPGIYLGVFAYIYSEEVPNVDIDEHLIIHIAPIHTNEKYAYINGSNHDNDEIRDNISLWCKKSKKIAIYTYWQCFSSTIYSRPILENVQKNLKWFRKLGVFQIENEGNVDCDIKCALENSQKKSVKCYDMNELYIWAINKLMWNPDEDINLLIEHYCKIVYKECAVEMIKYFSLIKKGWDSCDSLVWYNTGGDVYYLQFIIKTGLSGEIIETLDKAKCKAFTPSVKRKINSIYETVIKEINKYIDFEKEETEIYYCSDSSLVEEKSLDYINNKDSVWNKAKSLVVLKDYNTMKKYDKKANFSCKMLYDDDNIYIAYTIFDDEIVKKVQDNGILKIYREDGSEVESYVETYIGGDIINQSVYYGFVSGFWSSNPDGILYRNDGNIERIPLPSGMRDIKYVHLDKNPSKRYMVHVQVIPFNSLNVTKETAQPYGSFVYYTNRFGRAGWMGFGLWSKQNFQPFQLKNISIKGKNNAK